MKKKIAIIVIIVVFLAPLIASQEEDEKSEGEDTTRITIYEDGSAFWELETRFKLQSEEDKTFFKEYIEALEEEKDAMIEEKKAEIGDIVNKVALTTTRSMAIKNLDLNYGIIETINGDYGVVKFQFIWEGFAKKEGDTLRIGDTFVGGYYLSKGETMILRIPRNFIYTSAYPPPDETRSSTLIWYGPKSFGEKEPSLTLERFETGNTENADKSASGNGVKWSRKYFLIPVIIAVVLIAVLFVKKMRKKEETINFMSDEDLIIDILEKNNGKYLQNDIVKDTGFSKSKISQLLSDMEEKGLIRKEKMGRENIIVLIGFE